MMMYDDMPFMPYMQAVKTAHLEMHRVRVALFGVKPIVGTVQSVSKDFFVLKNDYSTTVIKYSEIRFISVYDEEEYDRHA